MLARKPGCSQLRATRFLIDDWQSRMRIAARTLRLPLPAPELQHLESMMPSRPHAAAPDMHLTRRTYALVLAGGRGSRLYQLTDWRAKPAVPFAGKLKIIDFPLSQLRELGHPPHRRADAVQGAEPDPPHRARLGLPRGEPGRVHRRGAGAAARRRALVQRHRQRGLPEPRHAQRGRCRPRARARRRPRLQDGLCAACSPTTWPAVPS